MISSTPRPSKFWSSPLVRLVAGIIFVLVPVVIVQIVITSMPISKLWQNILLGLFTPPVALGAYYAFVHFVERRIPDELDRGHAAREIWFGVLTGALLFGTLMGILAALGSLSISGTNDWGVMLVPFIGAVTSGVFEEILFRGVLYRVLEEGLGTWLGLAISGLIFGGLHLINPNATLIGAVAVVLEAGILLAACFILTRRLWWSIGLHFAWNFGQSGIFGLAVSGNTARPGLLRSALSGPPWLTGGEFGPEASFAAVILGIVVAAYMIRRAIPKGNLVQAPWVRKRA